VRRKSAAGEEKLFGWNGIALAAADRELAKQHTGVALPALNLFEKAAHVCGANMPVWVASAALAFIALGLIAGRLLDPSWLGATRGAVVVTKLDTTLPPQFAPHCSSAAHTFGRLP
jgi:hypothetical protein